MKVLSHAQIMEVGRRIMESTAITIYAVKEAIKEMKRVAKWCKHEHSPACRHAAVALGIKGLEEREKRLELIEDTTRILDLCVFGGKPYEANKQYLAALKDCEID